jgi:hypothetical protein
MNAIVRAGILGAMLALAVGAGFVALDKTTLHWYAESSDGGTSHSKTATFTAKEVQQLTEYAIADGGPIKVPATTRFAKCVKADYRKGNGKWIVTCEFRANSGDAPLETRVFVFDDAAGQVEASSN